jgi:xylulokinase
LKTLLAIDIGTSSTKAALYTDKGVLLASYNVPYKVQIPRVGWVEIDPLEWWEAVCKCTREVIKEAGSPKIAGVAVSGQAPSLVAVNSDGMPLRPAILWMDRRAYEQVTWLLDKLKLDKVVATTGNLIDSYYGGVKWLWFRQHEPELYVRTWKIFQASSFIIHHLTGQAILDYSQAGLCTPCFNLQNRTWDHEVCDIMGIDLDKLPRLVPSSAVVGAVSTIASEGSGIPPGTPVVAGGGDYALSCLGAGAVQRGQAVAMLGTAGNLLVPDPGAFDSRMINTIHVTGGTLSLGGVMAGGLIRWLQDILGLEDRDMFTTLEKEAAATQPGADGLIFLPYIMGERTPIWDPNARGVFFGLSGGHLRGHLYRAVFEGVALAFKQMMNIVRKTGTHIEVITITDGGASSPLWRQIFADVLGIPVHWQPGGSATLLGTALLAAVGCGKADEFNDIDHWLGPAIIHNPVPEHQHVYHRHFSVYTQLYGRLQDLFQVKGSAQT